MLKYAWKFLGFIKGSFFVIVGFFAAFGGVMMFNDNFRNRFSRASTKITESLEEETEE